jgi:hypothetical protein
MLDAGFSEQHPQVRLDRVEAQGQLLGDVLAGGRRRVMLLVLIRPAQRGEHRALRGCETRRGGQRFADERMDSVLLRRRAEGQHRAAYPDLIPVV